MQWRKNKVKMYFSSPTTLLLVFYLYFLALSLKKKKKKRRNSSVKINGHKYAQYWHLYRNIKSTEETTSFFGASLFILLWRKNIKFHTLMQIQWKLQSRPGKKLFFLNMWNHYPSFSCLYLHFNMKRKKEKINFQVLGLSSQRGLLIPHNSVFC